MVADEIGKKGFKLRHNEETQEGKASKEFQNKKI